LIVGKRELIAQGEEKLKRGLIQLLNTYRPYAVLLLQLNQVLDPELSVQMRIGDPTSKVPVRAGVDLNNLYWNPLECAKLDMKKVRATLLHEAFHLILLHHARRGGRHPKLWNYVGDKKCNQMTTDISESRFSVDISDGVLCTDGEEREMTTEELYEKYKRNGEGPGANDIIIQGQWDAPLSGEGSPKDQKGMNSKPSDLDRQMWENRIRDFVEKSQGKLPGSLLRELEGLLNPEVPWQDLLREYASEAVSGLTDFTWRKFNRMYRVYDYFFPGMIGNRVNVFWASDTSGSMGQSEIKRVLTEANSVLEVFGELYYISCDAALGNEPTRLDTLQELVDNTVGGGGTDFRPVFDHVDEKIYTEEVLPVLVYATDGYGTFPENEPQYPVIWLMIHSDVEPPFGRVVHVKREK